MTLEPAPTVSPVVRMIDATVIRNQTLCRDHVEIELSAPGFSESTPGQFVLVRCQDVSPTTVNVIDRGESSAGAFLRRPFSIADQWIESEGDTRLVIISKTVGIGTAWLERVAEAQTVSLTGPLGRGFELPPVETPILLVGGGVGIPPLLYLARVLSERGYRNVTAVFGAISRGALPVRLLEEPDRGGCASACVSLPGAAQFDAVVTSDDGSIGLKGTVVDASRRWGGQIRTGLRPQVCSCGPSGMLRAVARLAAERDWNCQLCIERTMACGLGACQSCIVRLRDQSRAEGWRWGLACADGPVFQAVDLPDYD